MKLKDLLDVLDKEAKIILVGKPVNASTNTYTCCLRAKGGNLKTLAYSECTVVGIVAISEDIFSIGIE